MTQLNRRAHSRGRRILLGLFTAAIAILTLSGQQAPRAIAAQPPTVRAVTMHLSACCVQSVSWSADGTVLAAAGGEKVWLMHANGAIAATLSPGGEATGVAWSPRAPVLAVGLRNGTARLYRAGGTLLHTLSGHQGAVNGLAWSPDGIALATASSDGTLRLWQTDGALLTTLVGDHTPVQLVAWSSQDRLLAFGGRDRVWIARPGGRVVKMLDHLGGVGAITWSPRASFLAIGSQDGTVRLVGADGELQGMLGLAPSAVTSLAWSPDDQLIAVGTAGHAVSVWRLDGTLLTTLSGATGPLRSLSWTPDSQTLAAATGEATVRSWTISR